VAWPEQAGWAEQVAVPSDLVAPIPDDTSFGAAATLPVAGVTALRLLRAGGDLLGRRVLVTGAAGGVGRFAVELAAGGGADVTGVTRNAERAEGLVELGAHSVVHDVADASGRHDVVLESVGGASLSAAAGLVAPRGVVLVFGNSSGEPSTIDFREFAGLGGARIEIFRVYESGQQPTFGEDLRRLVSLLERGRLHPQVGLEVSWRQARTALDALAARTVDGKAVLLID
jgi:NADPH:quinone reductase-like Zn-dependent oxidoreductase